MSVVFLLEYGILDHATYIYACLVMSLIGSLLTMLVVKQTDSEIYINQGKYARNLVKRFGLENAAHGRTPMTANAKLTNDPSASGAVTIASVATALATPTTISYWRFKLLSLPLHQQHKTSLCPSPITTDLHG
ncbi:uncharacterized protein LOC142620141 [Castanea sativa]|uniref:uncharacterized protein LOC142620141 n=1 Tax=Castanea sativa TaxID=21020 RepID=UPI003F64AA83